MRWYWVHEMLMFVNVGAVAVQLAQKTTCSFEIRIFDVPCSRGTDQEHVARHPVPFGNRCPVGCLAAPHAFYAVPEICPNKHAISVMCGWGCLKYFPCPPIFEITFLLLLVSAKQTLRSTRRYSCSSSTLFVSGRARALVRCCQVLCAPLMFRCERVTETFKLRVGVCLRWCTLD